MKKAFILWVILMGGISLIAPPSSNYSFTAGFGNGINLEMATARFPLHKLTPVPSTAPDTTYIIFGKASAVQVPAANNEFGLFKRVPNSVNPSGFVALFKLDVKGTVRSFTIYKNDPYVNNLLHYVPLKPLVYGNGYPVGYQIKLPLLKPGEYAFVDITPLLIPGGIKLVTPLICYAFRIQ